MKKYLPALYLILITCMFAENTPKIALVLSGGGSKGMAQVPTLQVIDSLNIPIDYVIGTSIGSITGALYSMGYSSDEILSEGLKTNWDIIYSNYKKRENLYFFQKNDYNKYPVIFNLKGISPQAPMAITNGHASYMDLNSKFAVYELINDFNNFKIPFRCNAMDLLTGEEIIFDNGSISKALRASSSIPSVFNPVDNDGSLLIDGGVCNNFPTDIAKKIGADIVIGVNVSNSLRESSDINTIFDILRQTISLNGLQKKIKNKDYVDILIEPQDLKSGSSYDNESLKNSYKSGQKAVYKEIDKFLELQKKLNIENKSIILPSIKENDFIINNILIKSNDNINLNEIFPDYLYPFTISKESFLDKLSQIRKSKKYINFNYKLYDDGNGYKLILYIEKKPSITINNISIVGNKKLSESFIRDILNINKNEQLDFNNLQSNIDKAYNLDLFDNIRYELENYNHNKVDLKFIIKENANNKMKVAARWHDYYKIIGDIKFDLINKPIEKFRITEQIKIGNTIKENNMNIYYIENFNYQSKFIPVIKLKNIKKEVNYYNSDNSINRQSIYIRDYSFNAIFNFKKYGYFDFGIHKQKINYQALLNTENFYYYSFNLNIDQIDDVLYPKKGYSYKYTFEKSNDNYKYYLGKLEFNHYFKLSNSSRIKYYGDIIHSNLNHSDNLLICKSIHYLPYDRTLSFSQFNLFVNNLSSHGLELNIDYKNSTTIRFLYNHIYKSNFKHNGDKNNNLSSFGFGLRVMSILGPLNFMWTTSNDSIYNIKQNNYFFNLSYNY